VFFGVPDGRALVLTGGKPQGQGCMHMGARVSRGERREPFCIFSGFSGPVRDSAGGLVAGSAEDLARLVSKQLRASLLARSSG
jgi:hypothetical protein